jgi:hypothetical protein
MKGMTTVAALVVLSAALVSARPPADPPPAEQCVDPLLDAAHRHPETFMFGETVITTKTDPRFDLVVTTAREERGKPTSVAVRTGKVRIFRADADRDDFTRQGGWYWKCGETEGRAKFKEAGALIMVVRQHDGTVHWYTLHPDYRC